MELQNAPIAYGEANTASFQDLESSLYYQADRIKNRYLLDFGEVSKDQRVGMQLSANQIQTPCLLHSIVATSKNKTDDGFVWELHSTLSRGVANRFVLQYVDRRNAPFALPEYVVLPEYVLYVIPGEDSRIFAVLEPINLLQVGTNLV
ncbi:MAG: hypothetical protein QNJ72_25710 [Pleurocapsa sp. MO_226.B13]|nr:hypothetical protein [Pleurocapsa sp. MO_226.B13]